MPIQERFNNIVRPFWLIWASIKLHYHAFKEALRKNGLASLAHPQRIRDAATANLLVGSANGFIAFEDTTCVPSLFRSAKGKILELGPGAGNQLQRYDTSVVDFIYGVEPNPYYAENITAKVAKLGLQDKYKLLACGIEDSDVLRKEGVTEGSLDTVLSIQVLCSVGDVESVMREVWKLLKPGGSFVFWEHERSRDAVTAMTQVCLNPAWSTFVGCHLHRDIMSDILAAGEWENPGDIEVGPELYTCLPRIWGVLKKKA